MLHGNRKRQQVPAHLNVTRMTLDDADHYSPEDKARIAAQYPEHERDTRTKGIPAMGSGRVFLVDEEKLLVEPFECPSHWVKLGGMDFGWTHFAAFCECWWDRDLDIFYGANATAARTNAIGACRGGAPLALALGVASRRSQRNARRCWRPLNEAIRRCWPRHDA
jgi:hypothetical protein